MSSAFCLPHYRAFTFALLGAALLWPTPTTAVTYPRYNEVYGSATHNSYWINRSDQADYAASGTQENLSDQLLFDRVRAIELDVHSEGSGFSDWKIYHTSDAEDRSCSTLADCLQMLRNFHYTVPEHEVINVIVELKNTVCPSNTSCLGTPVHANFAAPNHTIELFDAALRDYLGPWLYTPNDFLGRCGPDSTMTECAAAQGWPTIDQLRGKFIVNILGNWSSAGHDWVRGADSFNWTCVSASGAPIPGCTNNAPVDDPSGECDAGEAWQNACQNDRIARGFQLIRSMKP